MIRVCTMSDLPMVNAVMKDPAVYPFATYDGRPDAEDFTAENLLMKGPPVYVLMDDDNGFASVFVPETNALWVVHVNVLPRVRGKKAFAAARKMARWMFDNTGCKSIIGYTPSKNKRALMFNRVVGFKKIGEVKNGVLKDGQLDDLHIVSLVKGE